MVNLVHCKLETFTRLGREKCSVGGTIVFNERQDQFKLTLSQ